MLIVGGILILLGVVLNLGAWIAQIVDAFKAGVGWGLISLLGFFVLLGIPNVLFILLDFKERHPPMVMWFGSLVPLAVGGLIVGGELLVRNL